jgi:hypothetical protein
LEREVRGELRDRESKLLALKWKLRTNPTKVQRHKVAVMTVKYKLNLVQINPSMEIDCLGRVAEKATRVGTHRNKLLMIVVRVKIQKRESPRTKVPRCKERPMIGYRSIDRRVDINKKEEGTINNTKNQKWKEQNRLQKMINNPLCLLIQVLRSLNMNEYST